MCRHCHAEPVSRPRGLGWRCFYKPEVRNLYARSKFAPKELSAEDRRERDEGIVADYTCSGMTTEQIAHKAGLSAQRVHQILNAAGVLKSSPKPGQAPKAVAKPREPPESEMTMAEVEALIAEQMKHLPGWWDRESRRRAEEE